jgi:Uma2 family endonuclease
MVAQVEKPIASTIEPPQRYSPEEYLAIEVESAERHEYRDGEIIPMAGGLPNHNQVAGNIYATLNFAFRGKPYQAFVTDQRLWIPEKRLYTYPDVMVVPLPLVLQDGRKDTVMNPILIVEVLSKSTADYDRGDKFAAYRSMPGFQEYLLVSQSSQQIEHYVKRTEKKWDFQAYGETDAVVQLETVGVELAIADIYDKVEFETTTVESTAEIAE